MNNTKKYQLPEVGEAEERLAGSLLSLWLIGMLTLFIIMPPYWALMDDHGHLLRASRGFDGLNLWQFILHYLQDDRGWGMFRPLYAAFIYLFYGTFWQSSALAYLVIYLMNVAIFYGWGCLFEQTVQISLQARTNQTRVYRWLFVVFCFLFSSNYPMFFFASLQERLILLFGLLAYGSFIHLMTRSEKGLINSCLFFLGLYLAILSKATAVAFIPCFFIGFLLRWRETREKQYGWILLWLIVSGLCFSQIFLSARQGYTDGYQFQSVVDHFLHGGKRFFTPFWFATGTIIALAIGRKLFRFKSSPTDFFLLLSWPFLVLCFLIVMLPWRALINYYLIIPTGLFWAGCKIIGCILLALLCQRLTRIPVVLIVTLAAFGVSVPCARKVWQIAQQHHTTRAAVEFLRTELSHDAKSDFMIRMPMPCIEAADAMSAYIGQPEKIKFLHDNDPFHQLPSGGVRQLLVLNGECAEVPKDFEPRQQIFRQNPWVIYERNAEMKR
ncbi:MAG: hypothetical protein COV74_09575 [Candidatus Omnitrophica bacterium CG11_big_fil_rev_8_21_14_0_20_45_26]|uniref:Uncharacterized protein n=1 Tax=Candidatus Abzuiibacterium crystallinum TaxID=1974748 RepID=A0A2H0LLD7_9BACT|nr:MAG: hypothetical protein COV74_09575 [Candidatus Omnitrophica bacterium CG11_big_fil_rev_8_21_14_0_20_45_26]PIW65394.1 MAG: hypothetical protein COW12_02145 [Candidatus Omnitrophica bacterium CG12_big_fil_rev_8_21_14_0_65_45_16]